MPYSNVRAFHRAQAKIEGVRGTAETTMTRWLTVLQNGGIVATYSRDREDVPETLRSFQGDRDTEILAENVTIAIEARLSYEEVPWWFSMALKGGSGTRTGTTTGSTPPGYTYAITPSDTADDLDTFTLKIGDPSVCYQYRRVVVNQMTLRCNPNQGGEASWRITLECMALFVGTSTFDAPSDISRTMVKSLGSAMFLDTASAIGTTQLQNLVRNWSITVNNNIEEKRFVDSGVAAHTDFGRGLMRVTGDFTIEHTADTYFALHRANTNTKLRFQQTGAQIGVTPTTNYLFRVDVPQAKLDSPSETWIGNNRCYTYPFLGEKPTGASSITTSTVTAASTVTA